MASSCTSRGSAWILGKNSPKDRSGTGTSCPGGGGINVPGSFQETCSCGTEEHSGQCWWKVNGWAR